MKAPSLATSLTRFCLISALTSAGTALLSAQPAGSRPAGAGMMVMPTGAAQPPMYQQPTPYTPPAYNPPSTFPQQPYRPPTYTPQGQFRAPITPTKQAPKTSNPKTTAATNSKKQPTKRPPSTKALTSAKPKSSTVETQVARLESSDQRQDLRLSHLEHNVGLLPNTSESGGIVDLSPLRKTYVIRPGDTLWSVASKHGTSINALRSTNHLTEDEVAVGETLLIPSGQFISSTHTSATHIVKSNETFTKIARDYGISTDTLAKANPSANPDRLLIGERLSIPASRGGNVSSPTRTVSTSSSTTHTVKKGEQLGAIAKKYGISTSNLAATNRLKNANIVVIGQRLTIPSVKTTKSVPQSIAADSDTIPLHDMRLAGPTVLEKPEPPVPPVMALPPIVSASTPAIISKAPPTPRSVVAYRMERGDTLDTVANMFSTTPENIRALNKLPANTVVKDGDELVIPSLSAVSVN